MSLEFFLLKFQVFCDCHFHQKFGLPESVLINSSSGSSANCGEICKLFNKEIGSAE